MHKHSRQNAVGFVLLLAVVLFATSLPSVATERVPLAIKGYDPVAYFTLGKPAPGLPEIEYVWDEHRYRFSRAEHRELFKADPVRYAPQFANFCAMALTGGRSTRPTQSTGWSATGSSISSARPWDRSGSGRASLKTSSKRIRTGH